MRKGKETLFIFIVLSISKPTFAQDEYSINTAGGDIKLENSAMIQGKGITVNITKGASADFEISVTKSLNDLLKTAKGMVALLNKANSENKNSFKETNKRIDSALHEIEKLINGQSPDKHSIIASFNTLISLSKKEIQISGAIKYSEIIEKKLDTIGNFLYPLIALESKSTIVKTTDGVFITINEIENLRQIIFPPNEHFSRFKLNNKFGFMNERGEVVIRPKYDYALDFHSGRAAINNNNTIFYIDTNGTELFKSLFKEEQIEEIHSFKNGYAIVEKGLSKYFIRTDGSKLFPYDFLSATDFENGIAVVSFHGKSSKCQYPSEMYIDTLGNNVFNKCYEFASQFNSYNIAVAGEGILSFEGGQFLISKTGDKIPGCPYFNSIGEFSEGLAPFSPIYKFDPLGTSDSYVDTTSRFGWPILKHHGYIDTLGNIVISDRNFDLKFKHCDPFFGGLAIVLFDNDKYGLINQDGLLVLNPTFNKIERFYDSLHFKVLKDGITEYFSIDKNGIARKINMEQH
jgi:hypothetical protein